MDIIDLTESNKPKTPIELMFCLQATPDDRGMPYFYSGGYGLPERKERIKTIARLGVVDFNNLGTLDVIMIKTLTTHPNESFDSIELYLGKWNGGFVE